MSIPHLSASQLKTYSLCPRKWYFEKHCPEVPAPEPSLAMLLGSEVHKAIELYLQDPNQHPLETAGRAGEIAIPGMEHLPLFSELGIELEVNLSTGPGLPNFKGFIDLLVYGDNGEPVQIIDHKTCSSWKYTKTGPELRSDLQMLIYAKWVLIQYPHIEELELTHVQYLTKGRPSSRKETTSITREAVELAWEDILSLAKDIVSTYDASQGAVVNVPTKETGCSAYGGCPYLSLCKHSKGVPMSTNTLASLIANKSSTASILPPESPPREEEVSIPALPEEEEEVSPNSPISIIIRAVETAPTGSLPLEEVKGMLKSALGKQRLSKLMYDAFKEQTSGELLIEGDTVYLSRGLSQVGWKEEETPEPLENYRLSPEPGETVSPAPISISIENRNTITPGAKSLVLLIDCLPQGLEATPFSALISPVIEMVRTEVATDPLLLPYNEGIKKVAALLVVHGLPTSGAYVVDSRDPYWALCSTYFLSAANVIIRGVR